VWVIVPMFHEAPVVRNVLMALRRFLLGLNVTLEEVAAQTHGVRGETNLTYMGFALEVRIAMTLRWQWGAMASVHG
jgi:hypothetical protein